MHAVHGEILKIKTRSWKAYESTKLWAFKLHKGTQSSGMLLSSAIYRRDSHIWRVCYNKTGAHKAARISGSITVMAQVTSISKSKLLNFLHKTPIGF
jgi:hypothetical protein